MTPKILTQPNNLWWFIPAAATIALPVGLRHLGSPYRNSSLCKK